MKTIAVSVAAALVLSTGVSSAADLTGGQAKVKEVCQACHGMDGNSSTADYPKLGGQYPDYMTKALRDYKSGARKNAIMLGFAQGLTRQDMDNVSAYYAAQPAALVTKH